MKINICRKLVGILPFALCLLISSRSFAEEPFKISASLSVVEPDERVLSISVSMMEDYYLYADRFEVEVRAPARLERRSGPVPEDMVDDSTGVTQAVFAADFVMEYSVADFEDDTLEVTVMFQGCRRDVCFMPQRNTFLLEASPGAGEIAAGDLTVPGALEANDLPDLLVGFDVAARRAGYMNAREFLRFLDSVDSEDAGETRVPFGWRGGFDWLSLLGIILGGLALNLTPCVLPMIPVNIAIIGAGGRSGSRLRGLLVGSVYGIGIAVAYGVLGLVVVLTGSVFGAFTASPWFNIAVALIFLVLALAMFDVFSIDFSRFSGSSGGSMRRGGILAVLLMGMVSALLAGACVAPVVIFVLVHSAGLYASGASVGLFLPFLLGLGMALPWPLVGAGLSVLPAPGRWMTRVKIVFGVIILFASFYYAFQGVRIIVGDDLPDLVDTRPVREDDSVVDDFWITSLPEGLAQARERGGPVLIDFWASWCRSCLAMDATTFKDPEVRARMRDFTAIKYRAENPGRPPHRQVLERFEVLGLPTFVILVPGDRDL